jgi:hypothetical protein
MDKFPRRMNGLRNEEDGCGAFCSRLTDRDHRLSGSFVYNLHSPRPFVRAIKNISITEHALFFNG